jgi:hypothetical protein
MGGEGGFFVVASVRQWIQLLYSITFETFRVGNRADNCHCSTRLKYFKGRKTSSYDDDYY